MCKAWTSTSYLQIILKPTNCLFSIYRHCEICTNALMRSFTPYAPREDVLVSFHKDAEYATTLREAVDEVSTRIFGVRKVNAWANEIHHLVPYALYFIPLWFLQKQTLGEESTQTWEYPFGRSQRLMRMTLRVMLPYFCATRLTRWKDALQTMHRFHTAMFFVNGSYFDLPARLVNACSLTSNADAILQAGQPKRLLSHPLQIIGLLMLLELAIRLYRVLKTLWVRYRRMTSLHILQDISRNLLSFIDDLSAVVFGTKARAQKQVEPKNTTATEPTAKSGKECILCLEAIKNTAVTACGHVYCWDCLMNYCVATKSPDVPVCPMCRKIIRPQHIARCSVDIDSL